MPVGSLTLELQSELIPVIQEVLVELGQDLLIVRPGLPTGGTDDDGRKIRAGGSQATVRGYLYALDLVSRSRLARGDPGLPVPRYAALLPFTADVSGGDWHFEYGGASYYPLGDAVDLGTQGVAWEVPLGAPGQRSV
jgi:hypothetical protein